MNTPTRTPLHALLRSSGLRVVIALALATPIGAAAEAAGPDSPPPPPSERERTGELPEEIDGLAGWRIEVEPTDRKPKPKRAPGPFHPVVGDVGYGDALAAFGNARGRPHEGQDVFAPAGTPVIAPAEGVVLEGGTDGGRGNWVAIYDPKRKQTYNYFHMIEPAAVSAGEKVKAGQKVGRVGCTGSCSGDHLHFEIREGKGPYGTAGDPMPFLKRAKPKS